jgi:hypothetical protein
MIIQRKNLNVIKITKKIPKIRDIPQVILLQQRSQIAITKKITGNLKILPIQIKNLDQHQQEPRKTINISTNDSILIFAYKLLNQNILFLFFLFYHHSCFLANAISLKELTIISFLCSLLSEVTGTCP